MVEEARSAASPPLVGQVLGGRYEVIRAIGHGGMGEVYEGMHRLLQKRVAIKVLTARLAADDSQRRRFLREARAANKIEHENVVSILDFGDEDPTFFVMEFLDGDDLHTLVTREGGLRWTRAKGIILQLAGALGAAHARGIIHRDVKPSNCFVLRRFGKVDFVKVLDFGIAKVAEAAPGVPPLTSPRDVMGTAAYMAPEQARGEDVDARTDVYGLGVVLYEMLTGAVPFAGTNYQILDQHVHKPPPPPQFVDATISPDVAPLILKALEKDPAKRFQSMDELADAVARIGTVRAAQTGLEGSTDVLAGTVERASVIPPTLKLDALVARPPQSGPTEPLLLQQRESAGSCPAPAIAGEVAVPEPPRVTSNNAASTVGDQSTSATSPSEEPRGRREITQPPRRGGMAVVGLLLTGGLLLSGGLVLGGLWWASRQPDGGDKVPAASAKADTTAADADDRSKTASPKLDPVPPKLDPVPPKLGPVPDVDRTGDDPQPTFAPTPPKPTANPTPPKPTPDLQNKPKPPKPVPAKSTLPKPNPEPSLNAEALLSDARKELFKNPAAAYDLASKSYATKKSAGAAGLIATAACRMKDAAKARKAAARLEGSAHGDAVQACADAGITIE